MRTFLEPVTSTDPRPTDPTLSRYVRSFLILRAAVGALGAALPLILVFGDGLGLDGNPFPRTSISAYYYSGMRDFYVGLICSTGIFLVAYKVAERNLDNTLSLIAGLAALAVAWGPPQRPPSIPPSPLQERLGDTTCATIHFVGAAVFLVALCVLSFFFGVREGKRPPRPGKRPPKFWRTYHWVCAGVMAVALLFMGVTELLDAGPHNALLFGETASLFAFGASWLLKGLELDTLRGTRPAPA
jgi:CDP-diglyceride synthetase